MLHLLLPLLSAGAAATTAALTSADCTVLATQGSGLANVTNPHGLWVDSNRSVYVTDYSNNRILKWPHTAVSGDLAEQVASLTRPTDILVTSSGVRVIAANGVIYASDQITNTALPLPGANRLVEASDGTIFAVSTSQNYVMNLGGAPHLSVTNWVGGGSLGTLRALDIPGDGYIYASTEYAVVRFTTAAGSDYVTVAGNRFETGSADNRIYGAWGIKVDSNGEIWIADNVNDRVLKCPGRAADEVCVVVLSMYRVIDIELDPTEEYFYAVSFNGHTVLRCPATNLPTVTSTTVSTSTRTTSTQTTSTRSTSTRSTSTRSTSTGTTTTRSTSTATATTSSTITVTQSTTTASSSTLTTISTMMSTSSTTSATTTTLTVSSSTSTTTTSTTRSSTRSTSSTSTATTSTTSTSRTTSGTTTTSSSSTSSISTSSTTSGTTTTTITTSASTTSTSSSSTSGTSTTSSTTSASTTSTSSSTTSGTTTTTSSISSSSSSTSSTSTSSSSSTSSSLTSSTTTGTTTSTSSRTSTSSTSSTASGTTTPTSSTTGSSLTSTTTSGTPTTTSTTSLSTSSISSITSTVTSSSSSTFAVTSTATTMTTTTSNTTTTTTSSTRGPPPPLTVDENTDQAGVAAALLSSVANATTELLNLLQGSEDGVAITVPLAGGSLTALRLGNQDNLANSSDGDIKVSVGGVQGEMEVSIPISVITGLPASSVSGDSVTLVVSTFSSEIAASLGGGQQTEDGSGEVQLEVAAAISIDLQYLLSGESPEVARLQRPIVFSMPGANYSVGMRCAFWQEEEQFWSFDGVDAKADSIPGEPLSCATYHLSFFAAVLQGFVQTVTCAQFRLMTLTAVRKVYRDTSWLERRGSVLTCGILFAVCLCLGVAALLDITRRKYRSWKDEYFLLAAADDEQEAQNGQPEAATRARTPLVFAVTGAALMAGACERCLWSSSAVREALDEILSSWFSYFGNVRDALEALFELCGEGFSSGMAAVVLGHRGTTNLLLASSRRMVAASLGMTHDTVVFVLTDEDLQDFVAHGRRNEEAVGNREINWSTAKGQWEAWASLHDTVVHEILEHSERHTLCGLPRIILTYMLFHNPVGALFLIDIFHSCQKRVLLLAARVIGAVAMSCVFFSAVGMVGECSTTIDRSAGWRIGRFIAIATGSLLVSGIPVAFLESLQTKGFRKVDYAGSEAAQKQLRVWASQDTIIWMVGVVYIAACCAFIIVFLANIELQDHENWSLSGILQLSEEFVGLPLLMALLLPVATALALQLHGSVNRTDRGTVVRRVRTSILEQSNMIVGSV